MYIGRLIPHPQDLSHQMSALVAHSLLQGHLAAINSFLDPGIVYRQLLRRVWADQVCATVADPPYRHTTPTAQRDDHRGLRAISLAASVWKVKYRLVGRSDGRAYG